MADNCILMFLENRKEEIQRELYASMKNIRLLPCKIINKKKPVKDPGDSRIKETIKERVSLVSLIWRQQKRFLSKSIN